MYVNKNRLSQTAFNFAVYKHLHVKQSYILFGIVAGIWIFYISVKIKLNSFEIRNKKRQCDFHKQGFGRYAYVIKLLHVFVVTKMMNTGKMILI